LPARRGVPELGRFIPSGRSLLAGIALFAAAAGAYLVARQTSVFAVRTLDVRGGTAAVRAEVRAALAPDRGRSLLRIDGGEVARRLALVPDVASFRYDRSFPHTLRVVVRPERPVLVLRRGHDAFLVSTTGRVLRALPHPRRSALPRVWLPAATQVAVGDQLSAGHGAAAAAALAAAQAVGLRQTVRTAAGGEDGLVLRLASGLELRLGDPGDLRLKLTIARRILAMEGVAADAPGYLDVSVPERPVLNIKSQVGG
jgi:cell division protein FtsQ